MAQPQKNVGRKGPMGVVQKPKNLKLTLKKLLASLKEFKWQILIGLVCSAIGTILFTIGPDKIQNIAQLILKKPINLDEISKIGISVLIIYISSFIFSFIQNFVMSGVTAKISRKFRNKLSQKINDLPLKYLDTTHTGDILSRVTNDVDILSDTLSSTLSSIITAITTIVGSVIMMLTYSWVLTLIAVAVLPITLLIMITMFKFSQKYFKMQQDALGEINGHIEEIYSGHNVISIYNAQDDVLEEFDSINEKLHKSSLKGHIYSSMMHPIMHFIGNLGYALIIIIGGIMSMSNISFVAVLIAFATYYRRFNQQISQISQLTSSLQIALAASERIFEFLDEKEEEDESSKTQNLVNVKGDVEFKNVNFGYTPEKQILYDLNVSIPAGKKVAIVGSTGAGKTTLVNLLMRFYDVDSGKINIDGVNIYDLKRENVRKLFGMVLQDTWLFEGTIKENIAYGKDNVKDEDIIDVCKKVGIHHLIKSQPKGYNLVITEESNFSAGEKQLITIARAMLHNAPMLILDEATSSVDTRTELLIQRAMDKLMENRTSFIIAHRLSTIVNADIILVMKDGRIVEKGNHEELLKLNGIYSQLYNAQF